MRRFPFSAVVGQDDAKLALCLAAVDPLIGGVLLRGHKGSAKTTLARGLATLRGRFTEVPLGATEDRLLGSLDVSAALAGGGMTFRPGLLAAADGGVLYVDEINLLAGHLVDALLDVAVSGEHIVERDGVSHRHPARFVLVGSMNPEEGELRPQLLDRFGLCVDVSAPRGVADRMLAVRRRLDHDAEAPAPGSGAGPDASPSADDVALAARLTSARTASVGDHVLDAASRLALAVGAEGLRADLTLCRAAAALAGLDGRDRATVEDVRRVAPLVLAHRARRSPYDPPVIPPEQLSDVVEDTLGPPDAPEPGGRDAATEPAAERHAGDLDHRSGGDGAPAERPLPTAQTGRPSPLPAPPEVAGNRGRFVRSVPATSGESVAALSSIRALASRRATAPDAAPTVDDLRRDVRTAPAVRVIVVCVDLSGSMGAPERATAATATVIGLLDDVYQRRHRVALVGFRGERADILLAPTTSVDVARNRLQSLATGGATPLAAGLRTSLDVLDRHRDDRPMIVVLTDGRATGSPGALDEALAVAATIRRRGVESVVVDCEDGHVRLGLARTLADTLGASLVPATADLPRSLVPDAT